MTASMAPQGPAAVLQCWRRSGHGAGVRTRLVPVPCMGRARVSVAAALWHWPGRRAQGMAARVPEAAPHLLQGVASGTHYSATRLCNCRHVPLCFVFIFNMNTVHVDIFFFHMNTLKCAVSFKVPTVYLPFTLVNIPYTKTRRPAAVRS